MIVTLLRDGKYLKVERSLSIHCHVCNQHLHCPDNKDFWEWCKCGDVIDFYKNHGEHRCAAEIKYLDPILPQSDNSIMKSILGQMEEAS